MQFKCFYYSNNFILWWTFELNLKAFLQRYLVYFFFLTTTVFDKINTSGYWFHIVRKGFHNINPLPPNLVKSVKIISFNCIFILREELETSKWFWRRENKIISWIQFLALIFWEIAENLLVSLFRVVLTSFVLYFLFIF